MTATYTQTATIKIDWDSEKSIERAEREKTRLENAGWELKTTIPGIYTSELTYRR